MIFEIKTYDEETFRYETTIYLNMKSNFIGNIHPSHNQYVQLMIPGDYSFGTVYVKKEDFDILIKKYNFEHEKELRKIIREEIYNSKSDSLVRKDNSYSNIEV